MTVVIGEQQLGGNERLFELGPIVKPERILPLPETEEAAENRIRSTLAVVSERVLEAGKQWYFSAHEHCCQLVEKYADLELNVEQVAGILASLSPMQSWEGNLRDTEAMMTDRAIGALGHAEATARRIFNGEDPRVVLFEPTKNNPKVRSFFDNIARPGESRTVTIDRHIINYTCGTTDALKQAGLYITSAEYDWIEARFQKVAQEAGILPHQLQAIVWVWWRNQLGYPMEQFPTQEPLHPEIFEPPRS